MDNSEVARQITEKERQPDTFSVDEVETQRLEIVAADQNSKA
jgi:hypothetical protein